ncbi:uncharacterized protein LOC129791609 isoform X2 [Lutzomyia longipalpis]|uniref:Uncharacterized protein n=1 Tax=Lutzomyia longipalpis TaxID=7200 RepID=A0A7G3B115_LUTLO|nr:uncharacterized protein LOC129791609 isoform X2 [Lutzomyia longipalpis]
MCRCLQSIWEDFYWHCIEEKFCYDESIAHYNPEEDEYIVANKEKNGMIVDTNQGTNNPPICAQPMRIQRHCSTISSKIHEDDFHRDIQTNVPVLAPEILAVFRNSQIFHDHSQKITEAKTADVQSDDAEPQKLGAISIRKFSAIDEEDEFFPETRTVKPVGKYLAPSDGTPLRPRSLKHVQSVPHLPIRPSSETDIFTITSSYSQISMTPEIPSISFSALPKNFEDRPSIEYREAKSLQSIQTANCMRTAEFDFSMPRYFRHSELYPQSSEPSSQAGSVESVLKRSTSTQNLRQIEKSKRLKALRGTLPPLLIAAKEKH